MDIPQSLCESKGHNIIKIFGELCLNYKDFLKL